MSLKLSKLTILFAWEFVCLSLLVVLSHTGSARPEPRESALVGPIFGGLLIGAAQAITMSMSRHSIGVSTAYEDLGRALKKLTIDGLATPSISFALGIYSASVLYAVASPLSALAAGG